MKRLRVVAIVSACLGALGATGCAPSTAGDGGVPADPATEAAAPATDVATAPEYVFGFVSREPDYEDPRMVDWVGDECGVLVMAKLSSLPVDDPYLLPDYVVEFDADGDELRRWPKPFSAEIVAVTGERLHFRAPHEGVPRVFWTQPDGTVGLIDERLADPAAAPAAGFLTGAEAVDCPALPVFPDPASVHCHAITDAAGTRRFIAFEGACG